MVFAGGKAILPQGLIFVGDYFQDRTVRNHGAAGIGQIDQRAHQAGVGRFEDDFHGDGTSEAENTSTVP